MRRTQCIAGVDGNFHVGFKEIDNPDAPYKRSDIKMELKLSNLRK